MLFVIEGVKELQLSSLKGKYNLKDPVLFYPGLISFWDGFWEVTQSVFTKQKIYSPFRKKIFQNVAYRGKPQEGILAIAATKGTFTGHH